MKDCIIIHIHVVILPYIMSLMYVVSQKPSSSSVVVLKLLLLMYPLRYYISIYIIYI